MMIGQDVGMKAVTRGALVVAITGLVAGCAWLRGDDPMAEASTGRAARTAEEQAAITALVERARAVTGPLPRSAASATNPGTPAKIDLGRMLYYEPRLSKNHDISCNSCHMLDRFGVDNQPTSAGHRGQRGDRNSPTVYNAALHIAQFWDGRAPNVEEQAKGPVLNPIEMASPSEAHVVRVLASIPGYVAAFEAAYPDEPVPITYDNMAKAIGAFERELITPGRFDAFLEGDLGALSAQERRGLETFFAVGCNTCHMGPTVGGTLFRKLGFIFPYETEDIGREKVTGDPADRHVFKVPSLRNVARTAPYFHDGSIATLEEAVRLMGYHQLAVKLDDDQVADLVAFLGALTGEIDRDYIAKPALPPSGPQTPAPDPS